MTKVCMIPRYLAWSIGGFFLALVPESLGEPAKPSATINPNRGMLSVEFTSGTSLTLGHVFSYDEPVGFAAEKISLEKTPIELPGPADYVLVANGAGWTQQYPVHIQGANDRVYLNVIAPPVQIPDDMVFIPPGEFRMGAKVPLQTVDTEAPANDVKVDGFLIDKTEVGNADFQQFIEQGGYSNPAFWSVKGWIWVNSLKSKQPRFQEDELLGRAEHPVVGVSWYEADAYCRFRNKRLPHEYEWEKAARGPEGYRWSFGNQVGSDGTQANYIGRVDGYAKTAPVDAFAPNGYGLFNMSGNVWEWMDNEYGEGESTESWYRVLRGGSWGSFPEYLRAAYRGADDPGISADSYGFRCAKSLGPDLSAVPE